MPAQTTITVRMYNPGFGDCFLITAHSTSTTWRALIDCGVHPHGRARPITETVQAVIDHLSTEAAPGTLPHLDVVVATHRHADHISGFAQPAWETVSVDQVWLPFVEDPHDPDTAALRGIQQAAATRITALYAAAAQRSPALNMAAAMAANCSGNAASMDRLTTGRFATTAEVLYLPRPGQPAPQTLETGIPGLTVHVLGPPRDLAHIKRMDPPAAVAWLAAPEPSTPAHEPGLPLFGPAHIMPPDQVPQELADIARTARLAKAANPDDTLLAAASALERAVNNTSLFLVITAGDLRLVFPGDAQQGAWEHVLQNPDSTHLISQPSLYKVGHHGSHNATPRAYVAEHLGTGAWAMLPYGRVPAWEATIPKKELLDAFGAHQTRLVRADQPSDLPNVTTDPAGLWTQITLTTDDTDQPGSEHA